MNQEKNNQKITTTLKRIILFIVIIMLIQIIRQFLQIPMDKALTQTANRLNKECPIHVDKETRLDSVIALPNKILQYNYTFINYLKKDLLMTYIKKNLEPDLIELVKTSQELKSLRENGVIMNYNYNDKKGEFLLKISITPEMYK